MSIDIIRIKEQAKVFCSCVGLSESVRLLLKKDVPALISELDDRDKETERLKAENEWVSVEDRLPKPTDDTHPKQSEYMFLISKNRIVQAYWDLYHKQWFCQGESIKGTHWMPIPILPQPAGEKE